MKTILFILLMQLSLLARADSLNFVIPKIPYSSYNVSPAVQDTIVQKIYIQSIDKTGFWDSKFWVSFFPFLIAALSITTIFVQRKILIPSEASKLMLNKRFQVHESLGEIQKELIDRKTNRNRKNNIYTVFLTLSNLNSLHSKMLAFRYENNVYLSKEIKLELYKYNTIFLCVLAYAATDDDVMEFGLKYYDECELIFPNLNLKIVKFYEKTVNSNFKFSNPTDEDYNNADKELNKLKMIIETVGDVTHSKIVESSN